MEGPGTIGDPPDPGSLPPAAPKLPPQRAFGPLAAFLVFLAYLGAQFLVGIAVGVVVAIRSAAGVRGSLNAVLEEQMPAILLLSLSLGGGAALLVTRLLAGPLRDPARPRFGITPATVRQLLAGAGAGLLLGLLLHGLTALMPPERADTLFTRVAGTGIGFWSLVLLALVIAPPVEEFVFRGVIYDGLRARMPVAVAAIIVTLVFTALHATELIHYWPGFGVIAVLSLLTLGLRLATGSLLPAVVAHVVYNACAIAG